MSENISLSVRILGAIDSSLDKALKGTEKGIVGLQNKAKKINVLQNLITQTSELQTKIQGLGQTGGKEFTKLDNKIKENIKILKAAGVEVTKLDKAYKKLDWEMRWTKVRMLGTEAGPRIGSLLANVTKVGAALAVPVFAHSKYESIQGNIASRLGLSIADQKSIEASNQTRKIAREHGFSDIEAAEIAHTMVAQGVDLYEALRQLPLAIKTVIGQKANSKDIADLISRALISGKVKPEDMAEAMEYLAYSARKGAFPFSAQAKYGFDIFSALSRQSIHGLDAVKFFGPMMTVLSEKFGSNQEAVTSLKHLETVLVNESFVKRFNDAYGAKYKPYEYILQYYYKRGWNIFEAIPHVMKNIIRLEHPELFKKIGGDLDSVTTSSPTERTIKQLKALKQGIGISKVFKSKREQETMISLVDSLGRIEELMLAAGKSKDNINRSYELAREESGSKWDRAKNSWESLLITIGIKLKPAFDALADTVTKIGDKLNILVSAVDKYKVEVGSAIAMGGIGYFGPKALSAATSGTAFALSKAGWIGVISAASVAIGQIVKYLEKKHNSEKEEDKLIQESLERMKATEEIRRELEESLRIRKPKKEKPATAPKGDTNITINVDGDVRDPERLGRVIEPAVKRALIEHEERVRLESWYDCEHA